MKTIQEDVHGCLKVINLEFDSYEAFLSDALDPINTNPWDRRASQATGGDYGRKWSGTDTFDEAVTLARTGWAQGRKLMVQGLADAAMVSAVQTAPALVYDVGGMYPDIQRYLSGDPAAMVDMGDMEVKARPITRIWFPRAVSAGVKVRESRNYGIALLSHVDRLEEQGHSVELTCVMTAKGWRNDLFNISINVKRAGEPLDLDRAAFVMAHPAFFRRLCFNLIEKHTDKESFNGGYGSPCRLPKAMVDAGVNYLPGIDYSNTEAWETIETAVKQMNRYVGPEGQGIEVEDKLGQG